MKNWSVNTKELKTILDENKKNKHSSHTHTHTHTHTHVCPLSPGKKPCQGGKALVQVVVEVGDSLVKLCARLFPMQATGGCKGQLNVLFVFYFSKEKWQSWTSDMRGCNDLQLHSYINTSAHLHVR